ncbi:hypothetical protein CRENBAI_026765 [Crenichthys baileyi]|uniref:Uncharacterized protein n=1 Tax=Crenichthys baileyi TaxID=28760 RepID=A0AAV9RH99_9TELE
MSGFQLRPPLKGPGKVCERTETRPQEAKGWNLLQTWSVLVPPDSDQDPKRVPAPPNLSAADLAAAPGTESLLLSHSQSGQAECTAAPALRPPIQNTHISSSGVRRSSGVTDGAARWHSASRLLRGMDTELQSSFTEETGMGGDFLVWKTSRNKICSMLDIMDLRLSYSTALQLKGIMGWVSDLESKPS